MPSARAARAARARRSLDGLAIGDALGEMLSYRARSAADIIARGHLPPAPWRHIDDTEMAIALLEVIVRHGHVHQDALAASFAARFERDPDRGYGKMTRMQLRAIAAGAAWRATAANAFSGGGSKGNGSAMRVAPLGAWFADDLPHCIEEARASALVTHSHPEGVAGAVAVAVAAALAWRMRDEPADGRPRRFLDALVAHVPAGEVHQGIMRAIQLAPDTEIEVAARELGCGQLVTTPDTVPFCVWLAAYRLDRFRDAVADAIRVDGDCDTNAAIVGGIVALSGDIPPAWLAAREPLGI